MAKRTPNNAPSSAAPAELAGGLGLGEAVEPSGLGLADPDYAREDFQPAAEAPSEPPEPARARQRDLLRPYCPLHNCLMVATSSRKLHTNYACPVHDCDETEKRARPSVRVPAQPQLCPQRHCRGAMLAQALEVVPTLSTAAQLHMACPKCGFNLKAPRPQFDAARAQRQRDAEDLADR